ncbi:flagellar basal body P-ring formation protein FlgA [Deferribacter autotrophicus]|uniref:Flagellar basal body P-ring formation protein FlgA n=1 Tax=Deferribacter autotrophicus TaxID=500465 RepID=A0A5A8F494_9BACT|nr:flagellar basal body P-ring formation chaperone FlgA [Deferribacter autotrophicus]KAA0258767.1 flagellar basal body P-ring formation protein FlgA [Deferribacter autotrophicus]
MKKVLLTLIIFLYGSIVFGSEIVIDRDCLLYSDLFVNGDNSKLTCNFAPGDEKILQYSVLQKILKQNPGLKPKLNSIKKIVVKRKGKLVTEEIVQQLIANLYRKSFPDIEISIEKISMNKGIYFANINDLRLNFMNNDRLGSVYYLLSNGYKNYRIYAYVKGYKEVFVSKERIKKNEPISNKVVKKRVEITRLLGEPVMDIDEYIASRTIPTNRIVTDKYVIKKPDAFKGDYVKLIYKSASIIAVTKGILEQNAYIGNVVKVKNPSSGKFVIAKYVGDKRAIILDY